jgi:hypothetical protein
MRISQDVWLGLVAAGLAVVVWKSIKKPATVIEVVELPKTLGDVADIATKAPLSLPE